MNRNPGRRVAVLASLIASSTFAASTAVAAPDRRAGQAAAADAGPSGAPRVDGKAVPKRSPPARGTGKSRRPAGPARTVKPAGRKTPAPSARPPVRRTPIPRRTTTPPRGATPKRTAPPTRGTPRPRTSPPTRRIPPPQSSPPARGTPRPRTTPPTRGTPRDIGGRTGRNVEIRRDYFRKLWQRRYERDTPARPEPPAPRRRGPDRQHDGKHDGKGKHGGKRGGGHGHHDNHHHHASCGCFLRDWSRLLYGYLGPFRYASDPYDYRYVSGPTYNITYTNTPYVTEGYGPLPCTTSVAEAWTLLADGLTAAAYEAFECLAMTVPADGSLLVGLALSAAFAGEHDLAVTALRAAMRNDPVSLLDVPVSDPIDALLAAAADHYDARARGSYGDADALFMVAALRYLLGQDHAAHYAIEVAVTVGDDDDSTGNLKGLIEASPANTDLRRAE